MCQHIQGLHSTFNNSNSFKGQNHNMIQQQQQKTSSDISRNRAQSLYWHLQISASCLPPVCVSKVANKTNASGGETNLNLWFTWSSALVNTTTTRGKVKDECGWPLRGDGHLLTCGRDLKHARCIRWTQLFHLAS